MKYFFYLCVISGLTTMMVGAQASECDVTIEAGDSLTFSSPSLRVPSTCDLVTLTLKHLGKMPKNVMGHNWVLSKTSDVNAIANDGIQAFTASGFATAVKEDDTRVIAHTSIIGGGEVTSVTFSLAGRSTSESYTYFCSFPGHASVMRGTFIII